MGATSSIEWLTGPDGRHGASWNPIRGCTRVSEGCRHCYAERQAFRFSGPGQPYEGLVKLVGDEPRWTGDVTLVGSALEAPRRWQRRRRVFVDSMGDLFHERVPEVWLDKIFAVMALAQQHVFIILTKRPGRMREYVEGQSYRAPSLPDMVCEYMGIIGGRDPRRTGTSDRPGWPLPNVWLGVSIEDQATADQRIPELLATRAVRRIISAEPLLGPVELNAITDRTASAPKVGEHCFSVLPDPDDEPGGAYLDGVIVGGESGPGARPMHPDWARSLRDQCEAAGVAFFFKQWGEWAPNKLQENLLVGGRIPRGTLLRPDGSRPPVESAEQIAAGTFDFSGWQHMTLVGKRRAGRLLDGREHNELPAHA